MIATVVNVALVLVGSALGLLFRRLISQKLLAVLTHALGLCVAGVGISSLVATQDMLCVIVCMVVGTVIGQGIDIEARLERGGEWLRQRVDRGNPNSRFTESFVSASLLFCVGAMAITGSMEAGLNQNYTILFTKGVIDGVSAISFAATMGAGVAFSALPLLCYQGAITLVAGWAGPYLPQAVIVEMSAVGGALIVGIAINMLGLGREKIKVGNMLPAMFLPLVYYPFTQWIGSLF